MLHVIMTQVASIHLVKQHFRNQRCTKCFLSCEASSHGHMQYHI